MVIIACVCLASFSGCKVYLSDKSDGNDIQFKYELSERIYSMKKAGLFDSILDRKARSAIGNDDIEFVDRFINDTDNVLNEIAEEENGKEQLEVLNVLFNDGSAETFAEAFEKLDSEKAKEYLDYINTNLVREDESSISSRSVLSKSKINLYYADSLLLSSARAAYASNLEWSTIGWYTGFCASTIAGFYMISYGGFWTRIAGIVAATAGGISMGVQLTKWASCSDLLSFIGALAGKNAGTLTSMLNSEDGRKIAVITAETAGTVTACYCTTLGKGIAKKFVDLYNAFITKILNALPSGINYTICGIPIRTIKL